MVEYTDGDDSSDRDLHLCCGGASHDGAPSRPLRRCSVTRIAELEQCRTDERSDEGTEDAADDGDRHAHDRADDTPDERAPSGARRAPVTLGEAKSQPVVDDFTEKRNGEHDRDRGDSHRAKRSKPPVGEYPADHDPEAGQTEGDDRQPHQRGDGHDRSPKQLHAVVPYSADVEMCPDHSRITKNGGNANQVNADDNPDGSGDTDAGNEQQLCNHGEYPEVRDTDHPADVHRALKKSLFALETMSARRAHLVHGESAAEHLALEANGTALRDDGAHAARQLLTRRRLVCQF